jgi:hypothetical protein
MIPGWAFIEGFLQIFFLLLQIKKAISGKKWL